jgi:hypothetical protein
MAATDHTRLRTAQAGARAKSTDKSRHRRPKKSGRRAAPEKRAAESDWSRIRLDVHAACDRLECAAARAGIVARVALGDSADLDHARRLALLASRLFGAAHDLHRLLDDLPNALDPARSAAPTPEDPS